jgi:hypothetical protein
MSSSCLPVALWRVCHFFGHNRHKREATDFACGKNHGVGPRQPSRMQGCGDMLGAMARIALAWPAKRRTITFFSEICYFVLSTEIRKRIGKGLAVTTTTHHKYDF